jgi:hypothetical protein
MPDKAINLSVWNVKLHVEYLPMTSFRYARSGGSTNLSECCPRLNPGTMSLIYASFGLGARSSIA